MPAAPGWGTVAGMIPMSNRLPTGPGSRGGTIHLPGVAAAYGRAWKAAHPEYRERERLRRARARSVDPADAGVRPARSLPLPAAFCECRCACREAVVRTCGFCRDGMHDREERLDAHYASERDPEGGMPVE